VKGSAAGSLDLTISYSGVLRVNLPSVVGSGLDREQLNILQKKFIKTT
jgi:hypothetical protein